MQAATGATQSQDDVTVVLPRCQLGSAALLLPNMLNHVRGICIHQVPISDKVHRSGTSGQGFVIRPREMHASIRQSPAPSLHVMDRGLSTVRALNRYRIIIALL
jgi:hypothetical protein